MPFQLSFDSRVDKFDRLIESVSELEDPFSRGVDEFEFVLWNISLGSEEEGEFPRLWIEDQGNSRKEQDELSSGGGSIQNTTI